VTVPAFVTRPGAGVIDFELNASLDDTGFIPGDEWSQEAEPGVGSLRDGFSHGLHKAFAAIRVNGVIPGMCGNNNSFSTNGFRVSRGDRKHNPIAKWDHGLLHISFFVVTFGNGTAGAEQIGVEQFVDEGQADGAMRDA
jgi:hypothetical protein